MDEQQISLLSFYKGWDAYQALLIQVIAPLSSDQLALRVAPDLRSIGENVAHIISGRVSNFLVMGEAGAEMARLETWDEDGAPPRSAAELVSGLEVTWQMIQTALVRWTPADLQNVFVDGQGEQAPRFTRQWIIWSTIKHDLHHSGEVSLTLGAYHVEALDFRFSIFSELPPFNQCPLFEQLTQTVFFQQPALLYDRIPLIQLQRWGI